MNQDGKGFGTPIISMGSRFIYIGVGTPIVSIYDLFYYYFGNGRRGCFNQEYSHIQERKRKIVVLCSISELLSTPNQQILVQLP